MKITFNLQINHKTRPNKSGHFSIFIRVTQSKKHKYISTSVEVEKWEYFNKDAKSGKWISKKNANSRQLNAKLEDELDKAKSTYKELEETVGQVSSSTIVRMVKKGGNSINLFQYVDDLKNLFHAKGQFRNLEQYRTAFDRLEAFLGSKHFTFSDLTVDFIREYEAHLLKGKHGRYQPLKQSSVYHHMKHLRAVYRKAIKEQKISQENNPFNIVSLDKGKSSRKEALTEEEIERIAALKYNEGSVIFNARNSFLFQYYMGGMRVSDMISLKWSNIVDDRIIFEQVKTGQVVNNSAKNPKVKAILEVYKKHGVKLNEYIFPWLNNENILGMTPAKLYKHKQSKNAIINKALKLIAIDAEIEKNLCTHISRHSFASVSNSKGVQLTAISKALGHTNSKITEVYLDTLDTSIQDKALEDL